MLWEYRNDKWWELTVDLLRKALNCAYLTASLQEYVERGIESAYLFPDEEKLRIMGNINSVIRVSVRLVILGRYNDQVKVDCSEPVLMAAICCRM